MRASRSPLIFEAAMLPVREVRFPLYTEHQSSSARVVALPKPTEAQAGQWYFQRYVAQLPSPGEVVFFDRSWYNRAVVEPVMGFCRPEQTQLFLNEVPAFERSLVEHGIHLTSSGLT